MEVSTNQLTPGIELGEESGLLDVYAGLKTPVSDDVIVLSENHTQQIEEFTVQSLLAFGPKDAPPEQNLAFNKFGIPSLIVRVDCTINDGQIEYYEMEDSPSGIGITDLLVARSRGFGIRDEVRDHYYKLLGELPTVIVSSERRHGTDDILIFGKERYHYDPELALPAEDIAGPVIVKSIPGSHTSLAPYEKLSPQAVAPLTTEGDKTYLVRIGMCGEITDDSELLFDGDELQSQVVKAAVGSMAMGISIYLCPEDRAKYGKNGIVRRGRLLRNMQEYIEKDGYALLQDFAGPVRVNNGAERNNMIMRIFMLASGDGQGLVEAQVIGGCFVARPELIVHGASNSVCGAVLV